MTDTTTQEPYTITEYRDGKGREWVLDRRGRWYSSFPADVSSREDLIEGSADWFYGTLGELVAARGELTPLAVDNVEALLSTHYATCDQFEWYAEGAIEEAQDAREQIAALTSVLDAAREVATLYVLGGPKDANGKLGRLSKAVKEFDARAGQPQRHAGAPETSSAGEATSTPTLTLPGPPEDYELRNLNRLIDESMAAHVASLDEPKDGTE